MSDAINEDVAFKKKLYRKKLFFIGKKCYTIHSKKIVSVETDCFKKSRIKWDTKNTTRSWCIYERFDR
jgi:hypothetical protein